MGKLKILFVLLSTLTITACGTPEPNEPFLGKWSLDKEMTRPGWGYNRIVRRLVSRCQARFRLAQILNA